MSDQRFNVINQTRPETAATAFQKKPVYSGPPMTGTPAVPSPDLEVPQYQQAMSDLGAIPQQTYEPYLMNAPEERQIDEVSRDLMLSDPYLMNSPREVLLRAGITAADSDLPENEYYKYLNAIQYSRIYGVDVQEAYGRLDEFNDRFLGLSPGVDFKSTWKAVGDTFSAANLEVVQSDLVRSLRTQGKTDAEILEATKQSRAEIAALRQDSIKGDFLRELLKGIGGTIPQSLSTGVAGAAGAATGAAAGFLGGPAAVPAAAGMATMFSYIRNQQLREGSEYLRLIEAGTPSNVAGWTTLFSSSLGASVETLLGTNKSVNAAISKVAQSKIAGDIVKGIHVGNRVVPGVAGLVGRILKNGAEEGVQEGVDALIEEASTIVAYNLTRNSRLDTSTAKEFALNVGTSMVMGGIIGGIMGVPSEFINWKVDVKAANELKEYAKVSTKEEFIDVALKSDVLSKAGTEEQRADRAARIYDEQKIRQADEASDVELAKQKTEPVEGQPAPIVDRNQKGGVQFDVDEDAGVFSFGSDKDQTNYADVKVEPKADGIILSDAEFSPGYEILADEMVASIASANPGKKIYYSKTLNPQLQGAVDRFNETGPTPDASVSFEARPSPVADGQPIKRRMTTPEDRVRAKSMFSKMEKMDNDQLDLTVSFMESFANGRGQSLGQFIDDNFEVDKAISQKEIRMPDGAKAAAKVSFRKVADRAKATLYVTKNADLNSVLHELGHVFTDLMDDTDRKTLEAYYGIQNGDWKRSHRERFVDDMRDSIVVSNNPDPVIRDLFRRISDYLEKLWKNILSRGDVDANIRRIFEDMFASKQKEIAAKGPNQTTVDQAFEGEMYQSESDINRWSRDIDAAEKVLMETKSQKTRDYYSRILDSLRDGNNAFRQVHDGSDGEVNLGRVGFMHKSSRVDGLYQFSMFESPENPSPEGHRTGKIEELVKSMKTMRYETVEKDSILFQGEDEQLVREASAYDTFEEYAEAQLGEKVADIPADLLAEMKAVYDASKVKQPEATPAKPKIKKRSKEAEPYTEEQLLKIASKMNDQKIQDSILDGTITLNKMADAIAKLEKQFETTKAKLEKAKVDVAMLDEYAEMAEKEIEQGEKDIKAQAEDLKQESADFLRKKVMVTRMVENALSDKQMSEYRQLVKDRATAKKIQAEMRRMTKAIMREAPEGVAADYKAGISLVQNYLKNSDEYKDEKVSRNDLIKAMDAVIMLEMSEARKDIIARLDAVSGLGKNLDPNSKGALESKSISYSSLRQVISDYVKQNPESEDDVRSLASDIFNQIFRKKVRSKLDMATTVSRLLRQEPELAASFINIFRNISDKPFSEWDIDEMRTAYDAMKDIIKFGKYEQQVIDFSNKTRQRMYIKAVSKGLEANVRYKEPVRPGSEGERDRIRQFDQLVATEVSLMRVKQFARKFLDANKAGASVDLLYNKVIEGERIRIGNNERRKAEVRAMALGVSRKRLQEIHSFPDMVRDVDGVKTDFTMRDATGENYAVTTEALMGMRAMIGTKDDFNQKQRDAMLYGVLAGGRTAKLKMGQEFLDESGEFILPKVLEFIDKTLSDEEKAIVEKAIDVLNNPTDFDRFASVIAEMTGKNVVSEPFYFPIFRIGRIMAGEDSVLDMFNDKYGIDSLADSGMSIDRLNINSINQGGVRTDFFNMFFDAIDAQERLIAHGQTIKDMHAVYNDPVVKEKMNAVGGAEISKYVSEYMNELARPKEYQTMSGPDRFFTMLKGHTTIAYLGLSIPSIVKQLITSPMPFYAYAPMDVALSSLRAYTSILRGQSPVAWYKAVEAKSEIMRNRQLDLYMKSLKSLSNTGIEGKMKEIGEFSLKGLEFADRFSVAIGWDAVYNKAMRDSGGNEAQSIRIADDSVIQTQPTSEGILLAPAFRNKSQAAQALLMFMNSLNVVYNNLRYDLPAFARQGELNKAIGLALAYAISGAGLAAFDELRRAARGQERDDAEEILARIGYGAVAGQAFDSMMMVGDVADAVVRKYVFSDPTFSQGSDLPLVAAVERTVTTLPGALSSGDEDRMINAMKSAMETLSLSTGLPASQPVNQIVEASKIIYNIMEQNQ